jgi:hypothetical protein
MQIERVAIADIRIGERDRGWGELGWHDRGSAGGRPEGGQDRLS